MMKLRKITMVTLFTLIVMIGVNAESNNAMAASAKTFKGNLNVTYKNSDSKITIEKINSKKVKIKVKTSFAEGDFTGKIISNNSIKMNTESKYAKVSLKWVDKTHFKTIWKEKNENIDDFISNFSDVLYNNTKYSQIKKSNTVYYSPYYIEEYNSAGNGSNSASVELDGNKLVVKGGLLKGTKKRYGEAKGKVTKLKKATRTFKIDKNFKVYGNGGEDPRPQEGSKSDIESCGSNGLGFVITVKNGKATRIDFYS